MAEEIKTEAPAEEVVTETSVKEATAEIPSKESFWKRLGANLKERWRKFLVTTKRKPQRIAFFPLIVSTVLWMIGEVYFGRATIVDGIPGMSLCIFVNTMLSILTLLLFMNTFPKRGVVFNKKTMKKYDMNYVMLALTFVFMAVMIACDVIWYTNCYPVHMELYNNATDPGSIAKIEPGLKAFPLIITHLVFVALSAVLLATLPLYKKLLLKINTSKVLETNELKEEIDTSAEV